MKIAVILLTIFFASPLQVLAADKPVLSPMDKDIDNTIDTLHHYSFRTYRERGLVIKFEAQRLAKNYSLELVGPMKEMANILNDSTKSFLALRTLSLLGANEPVKQAFLKLLKSPNDRICRQSLFYLAIIDRKFARQVATEAITTTNNNVTIRTIAPIFGIIGDSNSLELLKDFEQNKKLNIQSEIRPSRDYLEYRLNLPEKAQKAWEDQAYAYWLVPKTELVPFYQSGRSEYFEKAQVLYDFDHSFSLEFLRYHLKQKDPLAAAILFHRKNKDAIGDLENILGQDFKYRTFREFCEIALKEIRENGIER